MSVILFIVVLVVLILIHELGHFIAARKTGMRVDEFGIGFPPRLASWQKGETRYSFNAIPLGGFVKIFGEDGETAADGADASRAFGKRPLWAQATVLVAGVAANVLLAFVLFTAVFMIGIDRGVEESAAGPEARLTVLGVIPGSPAADAGIEVGDVITAAESHGGAVPLSPRGVSDAIAKDGHLHMTWKDGSELVTKEISASNKVPGYEGRAVIGVKMGFLETVRLPLGEAVARGFEETTQGLIAITNGIFSLIYDAVLFRADLSNVAGPVGIAGLVGEAAAFGLSSLLMFTAFISLNLAIINLLPFPALDGGRLVFVIIEAIKGSAVPRNIAYGANAVGFILLMMLMAAVTYNDIARLVS